MQYRDALYVASILTILMVATTFLPAHTYDMLQEDAERYGYDLTVFLLQAWITSFCGLTGLIVYTSKKKNGESKESG